MHDNIHQPPQARFAEGNRVRSGNRTGTVTAVQPAIYCAGLQLWSGPTYHILFDDDKRPAGGYFDNMIQHA